MPDNNIRAHECIFRLGTPSQYALPVDLNDSKLVECPRQSTDNAFE